VFTARVQGQPGRIILAYDTVREARDAKSCLTCTKYRDIDVCKFYATCRAGKGEDEDPYMYAPAGTEIVKSRLTEVKGLQNIQKV